MLKSCSNCNRAFGAENENVLLCSTCDERLWEKVKNYLEENPGATVEKIHEETRVSANVIKYFLTDGRLEDIAKKDSLDSCYICGTAIEKGTKFCPECKKDMKKYEKRQNAIKELKELYRDVRPHMNDPKAGMHYSGLKRK